MSLLSASERAQLIATAEASFNDVCTLRSKSGSSQNEYGDVTNNFTETRNVPCGFLTSQEAQTERIQAVTLDADAVLRVSLDQPVSVEDEVIVRGMTFQVDGVVDGRTVRIVSLKQVSTEG